MDNKAAWLIEKMAYPFKIDSAPIIEPRENQVTIRVHAVAINPVDHYTQAYGFIIDKFPGIGGCDAAGVVTAVGSKVTQFKVGDRVAGGFDHEDEDMGQGTFQLYCNCLENLTCKIPDHLSYTEACVLPICMSTACVGLFEEDDLQLNLPQIDAKPNGEVVLVWGGASSVGSCGIQAAKAAGYEVAATAGAHNQDYCKSLGADYVFDYKSETLVEDVIKTLKGKEFAGVFDAVMGEETYIKSAEICVGLGGKQMVASVLPTTMPYEKPLPGGVKFAYSKLNSLTLNILAH